MKLSTKNTVLSFNDIDPAWCFEYLLNLGEKLMGQDIKILSPFSLQEKTPSFCIYKKPGFPYRFSCFSSGIRGSHIDLLVELEKARGKHLEWIQARDILKKAFEQQLSTGQVVREERKIINGKGRVVSWELRRWNNDDDSYWGQYEIKRKLLEHYNVAPLSKFTMEKLVQGEVKCYDFDHPRIYGYHRKDGSLDRIYRPGSKKGKFIKVGGLYIQGSDQIVTPKESLIYIKSLKDILGFHTLDIDGWDLKAPDGEGVLIPKEIVEKDKKIYKKILIWMDPDTAGQKAAAKYKEQFNLNGIDFNMGIKDLTDSIAAFNSSLVRIKLMQLL